MPNGEKIYLSYVHFPAFGSLISSSDISQCFTPQLDARPWIASNATTPGMADAKSPILHLVRASMTIRARQIQQASAGLSQEQLRKISTWVSKNGPGTQAEDSFSKDRMLAEAYSESVKNELATGPSFKSFDVTGWSSECRSIGSPRGCVLDKSFLVAQSADNLKRIAEQHGRFIIIDDLLYEIATSESQEPIISLRRLLAISDHCIPVKKDSLLMLNALRDPKSTPKWIDEEMADPAWLTVRIRSLIENPNALADLAAEFREEREGDPGNHEKNGSEPAFVRCMNKMTESIAGMDAVRKLIGKSADNGSVSQEMDILIKETDLVWYIFYLLFGRVIAEHGITPSGLPRTSIFVSYSAVVTSALLEWVAAHGLDEIQWNHAESWNYKVDLEYVLAGAYCGKIASRDKKLLRICSRMGIPSIS